MSTSTFGRCNHLLVFRHRVGRWCLGLLGATLFWVEGLLRVGGYVLNSSFKASPPPASVSDCHTSRPSWS